MPDNKRVEGLTGYIKSPGEPVFALLDRASRRLNKSLEIRETIDHLLDTLEQGLQTDASGILAVGKNSRRQFENSTRGLTKEESRAIISNRDCLSKGVLSTILKDRLATWIFHETDICESSPAIVFVGWKKEREITSSESVFFATVTCLSRTALENCIIHKDAIDQALSHEQKRVARELHDGLAQSMYSMALQVKVCQKLLHKKPDTVQDKLVQLESLADHSIQEIRRHISSLTEGRVTKRYFVSTVRDYTEQFCALNGLEEEFHVSGKKETLPQHRINSLIYIISEALSNVVRHAGARRVKVSLEFGESDLELHIADDGSGFDVETLNTKGMKKSGMGLKDIQERVHQMDGVLNILSCPGSGTQIVVVVPYSDIC